MKKSCGNIFLYGLCNYILANSLLILCFFFFWGGGGIQAKEFTFSDHGTYIGLEYPEPIMARRQTVGKTETSY